MRPADRFGTLATMTRLLLGAFLATTLLLGCGGSSSDGSGGSSSSSSSGGKGGDGGGGGAPADAASFSVRGTIGQIYVWKAPAGATIEVHDKTGAMVQSATADNLGSYIFRKLPAGDGYSVVVPAAEAPNEAKDITVTTVDSSKPKSTDFYKKQKLEAGFNYITTRDGTKLAAYVTLPGPADEGPYPTVVNYSGYNPAQPGAPVSNGDYSALCPELPTLCDAPTDASALIAGLMGYATVGVNMRGTGCSGGAYDYFEDLQLLDGYDLIETVAAQPWVKGNKVGMTGLSYPGITQLFVAKTHPPSLAAITPVSVIGGTYSTGRPGGIFNDGFALEWVSNVLDKAAPYGQGWEQARVDAGDKTCEDNQLLHGQKVDVVQEAKDNAYYTDDLIKPLDPTSFVSEIDIPVFLAGAFQDEQTGPFFFTLLDQFKGSPLTRFTMYNGVHIDGFAPQVLVEWKAFLDLYVGEQIPKVSDDIRTLAPVLFENVFKVQMDIPPDRFDKYATVAEARAAFEAEDKVRVLFEDGGQPTQLGSPVDTFEKRFSDWPVKEVKARRFYFQPDGSLGDAAPQSAGLASSFQLDPDAGHRGILAAGGDVWDPLPDYDYKEPAADYDVVFESPDLTEDLVMLGTASFDLWIRSQVNDADLEVNLLEVRPDGKEMYVQSGWLRASLRKLASNATDLWPEHTYRQEDEALLVAGEWNQARVGMPSFGHVFRKGSRIRVTVDTPGDSRASWQFALKTFDGTVKYDVGHSSDHPSSVLLPVIDGMTSQTALPACPSLRAQPCRDHVAYTNVASDP